MEVTVHQAKSQLSCLLKLAEDRKTVTIVRRGIPVARLTPVPVPAARSPLTDEEAERFLSGR